jgi:allophanate hydrolase subunit 2
MASLRVIRPGMLTTVQDLGRWGHQESGVPVAGPMDWYSHRRANRLAGNPDSAAALEVTLLGPELESDSDVVCAVAGAEFVLTVAARLSRRTAHSSRPPACACGSAHGVPARARPWRYVAASTFRRRSGAARRAS